MYVRPEFLADVQAQGAFDSLLDNTSAVTAKHFEGSAASASLQMGLKAALEQLQEVGIETVQQGIVANSRRLWEGLQDLPGIECLSKVPPLHGIVSFSQEGTTAADVKSHLMREGVEVVVNQAAYTPLDMQARQFDAVVRASPHSCSTSDEVENLIRVMSLMVKASGRSLA
jgi:selenocysteine lyase/cysteine desulfurase